MRTAALIVLLASRAIAGECHTDEARFRPLESAAHEAFEQRDFVRAAAALRQAVCFAPGNARAYHELGLAEAASGDFARADAALATAERLAPGEPGILIGRAQVALSLGKPDAARAALRRLPAGSQAPPHIYAQLGKAYAQHKQREPALAALLRAKRAGQQDTETLLLLATIENSAGAYDDAIQDALAVRDAQGVPGPRRGAAAAIAGLACKNKKKNAEAVPLLREAVGLAPNASAYLALAEIYESEGKGPDAIQVLERASTALPGATEIAVALGRNLSGAGDVQRAADVLTEATRKAPARAEAWRWLAEARNALGQTPTAVAALKETARLAPDYPMVHVMIAQLLLKQDPAPYDEALRELERAEESSPSDPDIFYLRGKIYAAQGRWQDAAPPLARAIELGPTMATAYYQLGLVYRKLGRQAEAARQFELFALFKSQAP